MPSQVQYHQWTLPENYESTPYHYEPEQTIVNHEENTCKKVKRLFHKQIALHQRTIIENLQKIEDDHDEAQPLYQWIETKKQNTLEGFITKINEWIIITLTTTRTITNQDLKRR